MTIPTHSYTYYAFETQQHADCILEYKSCDNASEATKGDSEASKQNIVTPPPPKIFIRRQREGAVYGKLTAGAQQSKQDLNWISQARRNAFEEKCAPANDVNCINNCDDDSRWAQIWNAVASEENILNIKSK